MLNILSSNATTPSKGLYEVKREDGEDNTKWVGRNLSDQEGTHIMLVGGRNPLSFRLRIAQAHVRHDFLPSHWSHVLLLGKAAKNPASTVVDEISLEPTGGFGFPPPTNGVQKGKLGAYRDPEEYPNIAILKVPVARQDVTKALKRFQKQRAVLDTVDLIVPWLAFAWGVSRTGNPLLDNQGIPSSAMLEVVFGAVGYDLTPGLESRSSCPEAIWQAAKWWHDYYKKQNRETLTGPYFIGNRL